MSKRHLGSTPDDFLKGEGISEEAVKEVAVWQVAPATRKKKIPKGPNLFAPDDAQQIPKLNLPWAASGVAGSGGSGAGEITW